MNYISDGISPLLAGIPLCKSQELYRREHATSQLCSIHHDIPVTMHTPAAYGQCSVFDHNGDTQSAVLGTRYGIWGPWYDQFEVGWLHPLQLWLGAGTSSVAPVLVSQDRDLCHVQLHPTWFEPTHEGVFYVGVDQWFHICIVDNCQSIHRNVCFGHEKHNPLGTQHSMDNLGQLVHYTIYSKLYRNQRGVPHLPSDNTLRFANLTKWESSWDWITHGVARMWCEV